MQPEALEGSCGLSQSARENPRLPLPMEMKNGIALQTTLREFPVQMDGMGNLDLGFSIILKNWTVSTILNLTTFVWLRPPTCVLEP